MANLNSFYSPLTGGTHAHRGTLFGCKNAAAVLQQARIVVGHSLQTPTAAFAS